MIKTVLLLALVASSLAQRAHLVSAIHEQTAIVGAPNELDVKLPATQRQAALLLGNPMLHQDKNIAKLSADGSSATMLAFSTQVVAGTVYRALWQVTLKKKTEYVAAKIWSQPWATWKYKVASFSSLDRAKAVDGAEKAKFSD